MDNIKLTTDGDIDLTKNYAEWATEEEAVEQHIIIRLNFIRGEWFLDMEDGTPYFEYILGSKNIQLAKYILKKRIEETPDLTSIDKFDVIFDSTTRKMSVEFEGTTLFSDIDPNNITIPFFTA